MASEDLAQTAREQFTYCRDTGRLFWRINYKRAKAGCEAGSKYSRGYRVVSWKGKRYAVHRVIWLIEHGSWPSNEIDHINGVKDDNRLINLRECTRSQNVANTRPRLPRGKGAWMQKNGRWAATITVNRRTKHLGYFDTAEEACSAHDAAADRHFARYAFHNRTAE